MRGFLCVGVAAAVWGSSLAAAQAEDLAPDRARALEAITPNALKGHLSFLASDLLEGRATPSRGLDIAAEYIASRFRAAGLSAPGDDGYFQTATWTLETPDRNAFLLEFRSGDALASVDPSKISGRFGEPIDLVIEGALRIGLEDAAKATAESVKGKLVVADLPELTRMERGARSEAYRKTRDFQAKMASLGAALIVAPDDDASAATGLPNGALIDPDRPAPGFRMPRENPPLVRVHDPRAIALIAKALAGNGALRTTFKIGKPIPQPVQVKNVVGLLPGSDPVLKDTYVLVTAHYDHVGIGAATNGDSIYNGANDDGSGTVSVMMLAEALGALKTKPKRSLVFMTFFGEERGLLGSRHYGRHPIFPIEKTIADVNLEQVGRTDSNEGDQTGAASMTGIDFSEVGEIFKTAGEAEGIRVFKHPRNSDAYFGASDNQALADLGVPAHTLCVAYVYPDYHGAGDHWNKINYENMAKVDRLVARALLAIADSKNEPKWNETNPKAAKYLKAWKERRGK